MTRSLSFDRKIVPYNFVEVSISRESNQYVIKRDNYSNRSRLSRVWTRKSSSDENELALRKDNIKM